MSDFYMAVTTANFAFIDLCFYDIDRHALKHERMGDIEFLFAPDMIELDDEWIPDCTTVHAWRDPAVFVDELFEIHSTTLMPVFFVLLETGFAVNFVFTKVTRILVDIAGFTDWHLLPHIKS